MENIHLVKKKKNCIKEVKKRYIKSLQKFMERKKGTVEAEEFMKKRTFIYYLPYCSDYSTVERMLKKYKEVYWLKEEYEE